MTVMKPKISMQEAARAIRERITTLVKKEADGIKDPEARRLFKASMLGSAHIEPGVHEPAQAGAPEHIEPGNHEPMAPSDSQPPADEAQPVHGGLGVPGGDLQDDGIVGSPGDMGGGPENGTVDMCPLCHQEDVPGKCTCLDTMAKNEALGYPAGPTSPQPMMRSEPCKKCGNMHRPMEKCGEMSAGKSPVKKALPPMDEKANGNKPNAGSTVDSRAGLSSKATTNARAGGARPQLSKAVDDPGTVPDPKNKGLPKDQPGKEIKSPGSGGKAPNKPKETSLNKGWPQSDAANRSNKQGFNIHRQLQEPELSVHPPSGVSRELQEKGKGLPAAAPKGPHDQLTRPHTSNQGGPRDRAAETKYWQSVKKADVPVAKPPSGKVPGGTGAPPMASNNSMPKIGAAPAMPKPPPVPGAPKPLGKVAPPPGVKQQMNAHMMNDASKAAQKPPAPAPPMHQQTSQMLDSIGQPPKPTGLTHPSDMGRANSLAEQVGGGQSFQPQPIRVPPKPMGISAPGPAVQAPKRSLFSALFGPKR